MTILSIYRRGRRYYIVLKKFIMQKQKINGKVEYIIYWVLNTISFKPTNILYTIEFLTQYILYIGFFPSKNKNTMSFKPTNHDKA